MFRTGSHPSITEGGIGLILIPKLSKIGSIEPYKSDFNKAIFIIRKYLGEGKKGLLACSNELEEAGLERFAKL